MRKREANNLANVRAALVSSRFGRSRFFCLEALLVCCRVQCTKRSDKKLLIFILLLTSLIVKYSNDSTYFNKNFHSIHYSCPTYVYFYQCSRSTFLNTFTASVCVFHQCDKSYLFNTTRDLKSECIFYQCDRNSVQAFCKVAKLVLDTLCKMMRSCFGRHYCIADEGKCRCNMGGGKYFPPPPCSGLMG